MEETMGDKLLQLHLIAKGAEANLYLDEKEKRLIKERIKKGYRISELDEKLRKGRTRREGKILDKARRVIGSVPRVLSVDVKNSIIEMEFISGVMMRKVFDDENNGGKIKKMSKEIGALIAKLHLKNIIHNDLTTSNMLLKDEKIFFIDFGLGIHSTRVEDRAMDLVVLKKALMASHPKKFPLIWRGILEGYKKEVGSENYEEITRRIETIEKRARYT
jgi:Kae1-associated kinase Bud32